SNPAVVASSVLWPVLAIGVPVATALLARFRDAWVVLGTEVVVVLSVVWETGPNPPLGSVHNAIEGILPFGNTLYQPYSLSLILLSKLYPVLVAFSVVTVAAWFARNRLGNALGALDAMAEIPEDPVAPGIGPAWLPADPIRPPERARLRFAAVGIGLAVLLSLSAWPVYSGQVEGTWLNPDQKGFQVPRVSFDAGSILPGSSGAVLLPAVSTYLRTTWGYTGASGFYLSFNYPASVL